MKILNKLKRLAIFIPRSCMQVYDFNKSNIIHCKRIVNDLEAVEFNGILESVSDFVPESKIDFRKFDRVNDHFFPPTLLLKTPTGDMVLQVGDYIIKNEKGEYYGCKSSFFKKNFKEI